MKYSGATRVDIQLVDHEHDLTLMIEDNGQGFNPESLERSRGNGWKNIQSRIQILKGEVEVDTLPERQGNTFIANIPKAAQAAA
jgi:signal transduction histidine kinase